MNAHALFVDDDEGLLRLAARSLGRAGYRVSRPRGASHRTAPVFGTGERGHVAKPVDPLELVVAVAALAGCTATLGGERVS